MNCIQYNSYSSTSGATRKRTHQACSLRLEVSISRPSRDAVLERLVKISEIRSRSHLE